MRRLRILAPVVAALVAISAFLVPTASALSPIVVCSASVSGATTKTITEPNATDCGGLVSFYGNGCRTLEIFGIAQADTSTNPAQALDVQFNVDTVADYSYVRSQVDVSSTNVVATANLGAWNTTSGYLAAVPTQNIGNPAKAIAAFHAVIPSAGVTSWNKQVITDEADQTNLQYRQYSSFNWHPTTSAAITTMKFFIDNGADFVAGSNISINCE